MRNDSRGGMGHQMRNSGPPGGGMKRRWDSASGSSDQQSSRPYQQSSHFGNGSMNGASTGSGYQQKQFRPNSYDQSKPAMSAAPPSYQQPSYGKYAAYPPMAMPPSLSSYPPAIASAVANYTYPPPGNSIMPPLPKN